MTDSYLVTRCPTCEVWIRCVSIPGGCVTVRHETKIGRKTFECRGSVAATKGEVVRVTRTPAEELMAAATKLADLVPPPRTGAAAKELKAAIVEALAASHEAGVTAALRHLSSLKR